MRILHHVNHKDFRKTHQRRLNEEKSLRLEEKKKRLLEQQEIKKIKELSENLKDRKSTRLNSSH